MIKYLKHKEIDKKSWDNCILGARNGLVYGMSWYLDIVCPDWEALVYRDYEMVMPLTRNKKYGFSYLYQPFFTQQLGVFSGSILTEEKVKLFINNLPSIFRYIEINLNAENCLLTDETNLVKRINYELDLNRPYAEIFKNYAGDTKRELKKAAKSNLTIRKSKVSDIINIFRKNRGKSIKALRNNEYKILEALIEKCKQKKCCETLGVYTEENNLCAGAFFITFLDRSIFIFSATNELAKQKAAMRFLIDFFISKNCNRPHILDFEGSNIPDLARFYQRFGSKECVYLQLKVNSLPGFLKKFKQ